MRSDDYKYFGGSFIALTVIPSYQKFLYSIGLLNVDLPSYPAKVYFYYGANLGGNNFNDNKQLGIFAGKRDRCNHVVRDILDRGHQSCW